jgi:hypothetical protein
MYISKANISKTLKRNNHNYAFKCIRIFDTIGRTEEKKWGSRYAFHLKGRWIQNDGSQT